VGRGRMVLALLVLLFGAGVMLAGCGPSQRERQLTASNRELAKQVGDLKVELAAAQKAGEQAKGALDQANQERDSAKKNLADTEAQAAIIAKQRDQALKDLSAAQSKIDALTSQLDAARAESDRAAASETQVADLQAKISDLQGQLDTANGDATRLKDQLSASQDALTKARGERDALMSQLVQAQTDRAGMQAQLTKAQQATAALKADVAQAQSERDALRSQLATTQQQGSELALQLQQTSGSLQDAQDRAASLTRDLRSVLQNQQGLQQLTQAQRNELADVRLRLEAAQGQVARLTGARGIYTVQQADSLWSIAQFFYHDGSRWPAILQANRHLIDKPQLIFPDMVLIVPAVGSSR